MQLQLTGLRLDEADAQKALAGLLTHTVDPRTGKEVSDPNKRAIRSEAAAWIEDAVDEVLRNHIQLQREWEERNPGQEAFPPVFAQVVMTELRNIDEDDPMDTISKLIDLAEQEMMFG
jgi:hypothetical protein